MVVKRLPPLSPPPPPTGAHLFQARLRGVGGTYLRGRGGEVAYLFQQKRYIEKNASKLSALEQWSVYIFVITTIL